MKTPITYYGGKQSMLSTIIPLIPEHRIYVEPFVGGGAVFWAKEPSDVEVINDHSAEVVNFYQVAQKNLGALQKEIRATLHSREPHRQASIVYKHPDMFDSVKRAWAFWVLSCQSYSASLTAGWRYARSNKVEALIDSKRRNFTEAIKVRLEKTQIECTDALRVIKSRDNDEAFFYCDPPYFNADMGHYGGYTADEFRRLLDALASIKGKFLLSSYPSALLSEYIKRNDWTSVALDRRVPLGKLGLKKKREVLTANYKIPHSSIEQEFLSLNLRV